MNSNRICKRVGFTLLELMVAVVVLLAVMIAVGRIFSTVINVSAKGIAIGDTLQQATAIEQQLREDIAKVSSDGFFAIRHVAVPNNVYGEYVLVDPAQPADAILRFDQLVFIRLGVATPTGINPQDGSAFFAQTLSSIVYYGHGVSFPSLTSYKEELDVYSQDPVLLLDSFDTGQVITPWFQGAVNFEERKYSNGQDDQFDLTGNIGTANGTQPTPSRWMLVRQIVSLGDDDDNSRDDDSKNAYGISGISSHTVFPSDPRFTDIYPHIINGRVDNVSTHLGDIRNSVLIDGAGDRSWQWFDSPALDQQELIASLLQWPRVEAEPSSVYRQEVMLMKTALAQGCVSFQVEWMFDEGVGAATNIDGVDYPGYDYPNMFPQPWWGGSYIDTNGDIAFETLEDYHTQSVLYSDWLTGNFNPEFDKVSAYSVHSETPSPPIIERWFVEGEGPNGALIPVIKDAAIGINEYWTIFGYNGTEPFDVDQKTLLNGYAFNNHRYTPRPSALKITLRLVDRNGKLGKGWLYQFIVDLPEVNG